MRLIPSDPDLETVVGRIKDGSIDLQPDFQRGAVWTKPKQQLLIDSILRSWYIPPVHLVRTDEDEQIVLDGQQRLNAVYEFVRGSFAVDGRADPPSPDIEALGGLRYDELPDQVRRRFDRFTIRVFEVVDYQTEEPYELFFRLNQPTPLTSAEKRNAFFGAPREQIAELARSAEQAGMVKERIGYSNARLAYEDVLARFVWTLELNTLGEKVTASRVTERFRHEEPFDNSTMSLAQTATDAFFSAKTLGLKEVRLNRAMTHSWLCFTARAIAAGENLSPLDDFVADVEITRNRMKRSRSEIPEPQIAEIRDERAALLVLNDRATARVNDVSSVVLRDCSLWALYCQRHGCRDSRPELFARVFSGGDVTRALEDEVLSAAADSSWTTIP